MKLAAENPEKAAEENMKKFNIFMQDVKETKRFVQELQYKATDNLEAARDKLKAELKAAENDNRVLIPAKATVINASIKYARAKAMAVMARAKAITKLRTLLKNAEARNITMKHFRTRSTLHRQAEKQEGEITRFENLIKKWLGVK